MMCNLLYSAVMRDAGNKGYQVVVMVGLGMHSQIMRVDADIEYCSGGKRKLDELLYVRASWRQ